MSLIDSILANTQSAPASEPKAGPAAPPAPIAAGDIDQVGKARAELKIAHAKALNLNVPGSKKEGLFFDVGTAVMDSAWESERREFEGTPAAEVALPELRGDIRAEGRVDVKVEDLWSLRASPSTGKIGFSSDRSWQPTERALAGLYSRTGIGSIPSHWPDVIRAGAINAVQKHLVEEFVKKEEARRAACVAKNEKFEPASRPDGVIRTRKDGSCFAVVSTTYTAFDGDLVLEALEQALPKGSRVNLHYDRERARGRVEVVTLQEEKPVVGEPFKTSFTVGWDDTGGGSVWGGGGLWSARCLNLTRIWTNAGSFSIRHAGSVEKLAKRFRAEFSRIYSVVHQFSTAFGNAASEQLRPEGDISPEEFVKGVYRNLIAKQVLEVRGRKEEVIDDLLGQFLADENKAGLTRAGIANGITRYAHRVNKDPFARDGLERAAGRIISAPKLVVLDSLGKEVER